MLIFLELEDVIVLVTTVVVWRMIDVGGWSGVLCFGNTFCTLSDL